MNWLVTGENSETVLGTALLEFSVRLPLDAMFVITAGRMA